MTRRAGSADLPLHGGRVPAWLGQRMTRLAEEAGATSIAQADTQAGAVDAARQRRPELILSDVKLLVGTGPLAVQTILSELGEIPVIFITGTPEACEPCAPPGVVLGKPIVDNDVREAFRRFAPHAA